MVCSGTKWRYIENNFINSKGEIVLQKRVRQLKTKSCNGRCQPSQNACESYYVDELISEHFSGADLLPDLPDGLKNGDELVLRFNCSSDEVEDVWFDKVV